MITEFAHITGLAVDDILGDSRKMEIVAARQFYWKLLRQNGFSVDEIARLCGFTRATVLHGIRVANERLEVGDKMATEMWSKVKDIEFEEV